MGQAAHCCYQQHDFVNLLCQSQFRPSHDCSALHMQDGCDFLIGSTNDGRLDLNDVFVQDDDSGIFAEPERQGDMPTGSLYFQEIPWELESFGDMLYDKPRWKKVAILCSRHHSCTLPGPAATQAVWNSRVVMAARDTSSMKAEKTHAMRLLTQYI